MTKTFVTKPDAIKRSWQVIDLKDQPLGRVSSEVAQLLIGKHKPYYTPNLDCGDYVVVINAKQVKFSGRKLQDKLYRHHTGHPGGYREINLASQLEKNPQKVITSAVSGMLPKNKLRTARLKRLKIFLDDQHPYADKLTQSKK